LAVRLMASLGPGHAKENGRPSDGGLRGGGKLWERNRLRLCSFEKAVLPRKKNMRRRRRRLHKRMEERSVWKKGGGGSLIKNKKG